jgi:hypothetical protein
MSKDKEFKILENLPEGVKSYDDVPDCSQELCQKLRAQIDRLCHQRGWPPDQPVLIYQPDGQLCKCYCK